ncbi:MAG: NAD-dependent epimerase/dehydratase family protein [Candidatus Bipolaricaulota bacterium]|nr:NAD-dependent epimerase/dehydratase family protein [Candidatus Bipolaricaulota bacterium]
MAEIFLTGATGFVGRHLVPALLCEGHRLRCLARSAEKAKLLRALGCEVVLGDLRDLSSDPSPLTPLPRRGEGPRGAEVVIHLAGVHQGSPALIRRTNVEGTAQLVQIAQAQGVKKILYLSTVTAANRPAWPYAHSVWLAEQIIRQSALRFTILRCSVIVGPGDTFLGGILHMARHWPVVPIVGSGQTRFQPISVHDVVRCILRAISSDRYDNRVLTIGGPEMLSYEQIVTAALAALRIDKRVIHLPRRTTRLCVRALERLGVRTPFVPGYFLSHDHVASSVTLIEDEFGLRPQRLQEVLAAIIAGGVARPQRNLYC